MLKNIIKLVKSLITKDTDLFQKATCGFFGIEQELKILNTYGISYRPPNDSFGVAFSANGDMNETFVIIDRPDLRFTGLEQGELKIGNYVTTDYVYFKADGTIEVKASSVNIIGNATISGNAVVTGTVTAADFITSAVPSYNAHVHSGVQSGPSNTGGPQ